MTLTDFLLACIAEDEAVIREPQFATLAEPIDREQLLAECEAKRRIVSVHEWRGYCVGCDPFGDGGPEPCLTLPHLAAVYADHPDYREEWRG